MGKGAPFIVLHGWGSGSDRWIKEAEIISKKGYAELIRLAVYNMLPPNRLRQPMMNKLKITE